jgi:nucleoside-diphosphate-sugar epimerase
MGQRVAVIGFGVVGRETASLLAARGDEVRIVQRHRLQGILSGSAFQGADVEDGEAMRRACAGVGAVACCIGLPYDSALWARAWPRAMSNLIDGCAASGARLVFADNLYMYGPQTRPLTEDMPLTSYGKKPRVRAEITQGAFGQQKSVLAVPREVHRAVGPRWGARLGTGAVGPVNRWQPGL